MGLLMVGEMCLARLIPVRALALRAPGRELSLARWPGMTTAQAGVELELKRFHLTLP